MRINSSFSRCLKYFYDRNDDDDNDDFDYLSGDISGDDDDGFGAESCGNSLKK